MTIGKTAAGVAVATALLLGGAGLASAQTSSTTTSTASTTSTGVTTPSSPNTGAGGDMAGNLLLLGVSALVAVGSGAYVARKSSQYS